MLKDFGFGVKKSMEGAIKDELIDFIYSETGFQSRERPRHEAHVHPASSQCALEHDW